MRVARAFRYSMIAAMAALALSGCMRRSAPVAVVQPQSDLDSLAYGQTYNSPPRGVVTSHASPPQWSFLKLVFDRLRNGEQEGGHSR